MKSGGRDGERPRIDTSEFTRTGATVGGVQPVAAMPRLRELLADDAGEIEWTLTGERRSRAEGGFDQFMRLRISGAVAIACIRCLRPVPVDLHEGRFYKLALTESQAASEDAEAEDFDVLAADPRFDVLELVEDEAIMALPIAPRHPDCSVPAHARPSEEPSSAEAEKPNPFAILERLRRRGGDSTDEG